MQDLIKVDNVEFSPDDETIFSNVSFTIKAGQNTSISGPSGSGKSTLLKMISNLLPTNAGTVYFKDKDINSYEYTAYRREVSYCFQNPELFGETVKDNLAFPALIREDEFNEARARELMQRLGLKHIKFDSANVNLSGGERQRVALIRNLMYPPKVLLMDEISSSLDKKSRDLQWQLLLEISEEEDITLVWVSHDEEEQKKAEQQLFLEDGNLESLEVENG